MAPERFGQMALTPIPNKGHPKPGAGKKEKDACPCWRGKYYPKKSSRGERANKSSLTSLAKGPENRPSRGGGPQAKVVVGLNDLYISMAQGRFLVPVPGGGGPNGDGSRWVGRILGPENKKARAAKFCGRESPN